jgi:PAS domain S-box-containing protein
MISVFKKPFNCTVFKVLLVEDNLVQAKLLQELLLDVQGVRVTLSHVQRLSEAIEALNQNDFDVILLDLSLPDSQGLDTLVRVQEYVCQGDNCAYPAIIVLIGHDERELAVLAIRAGAQDCLVRDKIESELLIRSLGYATERQYAAQPLQNPEGKYRCIISNNKDISFSTEFKQAKQELDRFFSISLDLLCIAGFDGYFKRLNPAWETTLGYTIPELLARPFLEFVHPEDREATQREVQKLNNGGTLRVNFENRYIRKDGSCRWFLWTAMPFFEEGLTYAVARDITEQKLAQEALHHSERRLRSYFENSIVGIVILTPDKGWIEVNEALCNLLGYSREELSKTNWIEWTHPDDRELELEQLMLVFAGESDGYVLDKRFIRKNGQVVYTRISVRCIRREDGACDHLIAVILDISDRYHYEQQLKSSEAFLNHIINTLADPIFVKDEHHRWILLNEACCRWMGKSPSELIGKSDYDFFPQSEADVFWEKDEVVFTTGLENENEEHFTDAEGNFHTISTKKNLFKDADGSKILVGTIRDITNYKHLLEALQQSEARFQKLAANVPGMIFEFVRHTDGSFSYPYVSSACREICEVEPEQLQENAALALDQVHLDDRESFYQAIATSAQTLEPFAWEGRIIGHTSGKLKWIQSASRPEKLANGDILWHGVAIDISDRKLAEIALQQQLLREQLVGKMQERIRRTLNLQDVLTTAVEEVRQFLQTDRTIIYRFYPDWSGAIEVESVGGGWMPLLGLDIQDNCFPQTYVSQYQHGRIRAIDDIYNAGLHPCHINLLSELEVKANLVVPLLQGETLWGLLIAHHCRSSRQWQSFEIECLRQLSVQLAIAIQQSVLFEQAQTEIAERKRVEESLRRSELRERKRAKQLTQAIQHLKNAQTQLVQSEKMASLGQLVAGIAHEINNPISFIYGNVGPACDYSLNLLELISLYQQHYPTPAAEIQDKIAAIDLDFIKEDFPKLLGSMHEGASRIQEIVQSLRSFSHHNEAERKKADLHQGIDSTLKILQNRLRKQTHRPAIQVIKEYGDLPLLECYSGELNQVFMNLLSNAIDALEERFKEDASLTPIILIRTGVVRVNHQTAERQNYLTQSKIQNPKSEIDFTDKVVIRIADNGSGIPPNVQKRLFDPFFTTKPVGKGTGLGLSISHSIVVNKHKGKLYFNSQLGQGTEFAIELPQYK